MEPASCSMHIDFRDPQSTLPPFPVLVRLGAWPCCLRQQFLDAMRPDNPRGLSIDLGDYEFSLTFIYPAWPLVEAKLRIRYHLWSDPTVFALLYPDPVKFPGQHPEKWVGPPEQIALHTLSTLEQVFATGLCHMPRSKAAKEQKRQFLRDQRRQMN